MFNQVNTATIIVWGEEGIVSSPENVGPYSLLLFCYCMYSYTRCNLVQFELYIVSTSDVVASSPGRVVSKITLW